MGVKSSMDSRWYQLNVVVPREWREKIVSRVKARGHASVGEYIRDLIREDLMRSGLLQG